MCCSLADATAIMSVLQVMEDVAHDAAEQAQPTADAAKQQVDAAAETVEKQVIIPPCCRLIRTLLTVQYCSWTLLHKEVRQLILV